MPDTAISQDARHCQGKGHSPESAWTYNDKLAKASGPDVELTPAWRVRLSELSFAYIFGRPDTFRDQWSDEEKREYEAAAAECDKILVKHRLSRYPASKL